MTDNNSHLPPAPSWVTDESPALTPEQNWLIRRRGMEQSPAVSAVIASTSADAQSIVDDDGNRSTKTYPPIEYIESLIALGIAGHGGVPEALEAGLAVYRETYEKSLLWVDQDVNTIVNPRDDGYALRNWISAVKRTLAGKGGVLDAATEAAMFVDMSAVLVARTHRSPDIGMREDGTGILYSGTTCMLYGPPEEGKTLAATAIVVQELNKGCSVLWLDLDNNGRAETKSRLVAFGATEAQLENPNLFRFAEPTTAVAIQNLVSWAVNNMPRLIIIDSLGKLMAAWGIRSDGDGEYADLNTRVMARMAAAGSCVLLIDHTTKSDRDDGYSIGTQRKKSDIDGVMLRAKSVEKFVPNHGGQLSLVINKDRPGGLRASTAIGAGNRKQIAAVFTMGTDSSDSVFEMSTGAAPGVPKPEIKLSDDLETLRNLKPAASSVNDVKARLGWGSARASTALKAYRETILTA